MKNNIGDIILKASRDKNVSAFFIFCHFLSHVIIQAIQHLTDFTNEKSTEKPYGFSVLYLLFESPQALLI